MRLVVAEIVVQKREALLGIVVAVEVDAGVRWVVKVVVEALELVKAEGWDVARVAAGIHAVGRVGEDGLLDALA